MQVKKLKKSKNNNAYLVGPFLGELNWEILRFAPYIIHLKKKKRQNKIIVFTRSSRFDLYGQYADIFVPLNIPVDDIGDQVRFGHKQFNISRYNLLIDALYKKYQKRFEIDKHIYPDIENFYYKLKWQFPRDLMDYNFRPRKQNKEFIDEYIDTNKVIFVNFKFSEGMQVVSPLEKMGYFCIFLNMFTEDFLVSDKQNISFLGCIIELLKRCDFIISKFDSHITYLSLLLETPVISVGKIASSDSISLINPKNTMIINCDNAVDGIEIWKENKCE